MSELLLGFLSKLAIAGAKAGAARLLKETPTAKAIEAAIVATADELGHLEGVSDDLRRWCKSEDFVNLLEQLTDGVRPEQPREVVSSFVKTTGFYLGDRTNRTARAILDAFARHFEAELHKSDAGLPIHAAREEVLHERTQTMIGTMLSASAEQDQGLQKTRRRFAEKVSDIYGDLALRFVCGGDSMHHQETLTTDVARVAALRPDEVDRIDSACRHLATDMLVRLGTVAGLAEEARRTLEQLRPAFGSALSASIWSAFDGMIDALDSIVNLAPRHPAPSHSEVKQRARIPRALADLHAYITHAEALDASFRQLFLLAAGQSPDGDGPVSVQGVRMSIEWYRRYHTVIDRSWKSIAECTTLVEDSW